MENNNIQLQINQINSKLDLILEEIELQKRHRRETEDLKDDLTRVGKDLFKTAVEELDDIHDYLTTGDMLHFFKKLLRNIKTISSMFDQVESLRDFVNDASPLTKDLIIDLMYKLDEFDKKGYFQFSKELLKIADNVVTSFTLEDVKNLADNVVTILNTVKNLTQPDMLHTVNNAVNVYKKLDIEIKDEVSFLSLLKEFNTPEMKKGLSFAIKFLKSLANTANGNKLNYVQSN